MARPLKPKVTRKLLEAAIAESCGTQTSVAAKLKCHHSAVQHGLKKYPELKEALAERRKVADDCVSDTVFRLAVAGDTKAIESWKKYIMGIGIRLDMHHTAEVQPIVVKFIDYRDVNDV